MFAGEAEILTYHLYLDRAAALHKGETMNFENLSAHVTCVKIRPRHSPLLGLVYIFCQSVYNDYT
jgi:hypothetical protein